MYEYGRTWIAGLERSVGPAELMYDTKLNQKDYQD